VQLLHKAKHGKKGRNLSWHGVVLVGDMLGPGVQMSTVTLQGAQAMPAWSVNWCACSKQAALSLSLRQYFKSEEMKRLYKYRIFKTSAIYSNGILITF
jgi:hypothetical protein